VAGAGGGAGLGCLQPTDPQRCLCGRYQPTPRFSHHLFSFLPSPLPTPQVHLFCAVYFMLYMVAFTGITIWWVDRLLLCLLCMPRGA
jgi:hypothetical protein